MVENLKKWLMENKSGLFTIDAKQVFSRCWKMGFTLTFLQLP